MVNSCLFFYRLLVGVKKAWVNLIYTAKKRASTAEGLQCLIHVHI